MTLETIAGVPGDDTTGEPQMLAIKAA